MILAVEFWPGESRVESRESRVESRKSRAESRSVVGSFGDIKSIEIKSLQS